MSMSQAAPLNIAWDCSGEHDVVDSCAQDPPKCSITSSTGEQVGPTRFMRTTGCHVCVLE